MFSDDGAQELLEKREAEIRAKAGGLFGSGLILNFVWFEFYLDLICCDVQAEAHERRVREKEERAQKEQQRMLQQQQGKRP